MPLRRSWPAVVLAAILFAYIVYPVLAMLAQSVTLPVDDYRAEAMGWDPRQQPIAAPLRRLIAEPHARDAVIRTIELAIATVILATLWGGGLALLWWRREFPFRRYFAMFGYAPILLPPLVGALAFYRLAGDGGLLWRLLGSSTGVPPIGGFSQVLLVHTYSFGIYTYAYVAAALEDRDTAQEDAARSLGASTFRSFVVAVWPAIRAPFFAGALIIFMASSASFSAPYFLDNTGRYLTVEILTEADTGMQRALSVVLAGISLSALPAFLYLNRRGRFGADAAFSVKGAARRQLPPAGPAGSVLRLALSCIALLILLAPLLTVLASAVTEQRPSAQQNSMFDIATRLGFEDWASLGRSALYALGAALADIVLAVAIALSLRNAGWICGSLVEFAVMLALALPGSALAVALLSVFNGPSPLSFGAPLGQTATILMLAYLIRNLPLAVRPVSASFKALGRELEQAASGLGAGTLSVLWRVTLPLIFPSLLAAALICFITGLGEYVASKLLFGVMTRPVSVRIDEIYRADPAAAYALSVWLMVASGLAVAAARWLRRK